MNNTYQITEYGSFVCNKNIAGYVSLPEHTFSALEEFILTNQGNETEAIEIMGISARKGIGKIITAKNYVGIIKMNDNTVIEILPKIYSETQDDEAGTHTKKLLINMLKTLKNAPYKTFQTGNVSMEKMNIFEIFIRMFIDEVFLIVKKGLKCNYEIVEENVSYFKGKMKFAEQMKFNRFHKERNFIEHDVFTTNRPENRIIKATLLYLLKHSGVSKNRNDIKTLLNYFCDVEVSKDYKKDFSKYILDRNTKDYEVAMLWSKIFLMGKSFTSFAGSEVAYALLFPMETLFESYIATLLKRELVNTGYQISVQDKKYHLFDEPAKKFLMKPDIVITNKSEQSVYVMDTKWKILSENKPNYGIAQSDMYQMYAYQKKYSAANITLIYPKTDNLSGKQVIDFHSNDGVLIKIRFVDLFNIGKLEGFLD